MVLPFYCPAVASGGICVLNRSHVDDNFCKSNNAKTAECKRKTALIPVSKFIFCFSFAMKLFILFVSKTTKP